MKWYWILSKAFSASTEMMLLLMCCITFIGLRMLNHPGIPWMKLTCVVNGLSDVLLNSVWKKVDEEGQKE
jgi:hypothetical protein